jgi:hypothetical protein
LMPNNLFLLLGYAEILGGYREKGHLYGV